MVRSVLRIQPMLYNAERGISAGCILLSTAKASIAYTYNRLGQQKTVTDITDRHFDF